MIQGTISRFVQNNIICSNAYNELQCDKFLAASTGKEYIEQDYVPIVVEFELSWLVDRII